MTVVVFMCVITSPSVAKAKLKQSVDLMHHVQEKVKYHNVLKQLQVYLVFFLFSGT